MKTTTVDVGGKHLTLSNLTKVFYPQSGFTKAQVIDYYRRIAPVLLPHLKDRPLTLKRYPNGVTGSFFYEKRCPSHRPDWVKTAPVWSDANNDYVNFCLANDLPTLVWAANLAVLELHTSLSLQDDADKPTVLAFDLDPGPPANIIDCARVAFWLRELLATMGLEGYPKTSGSKGLQIYVPLNTPAHYDQTKPLSHQLAQTLETQHPQHVVSNMRKSLRTGKVLVDWSQNDRHKTTVCVYSLRAKDRPTVSTPVTWNEVERALKSNDPTRLEFDWQQVLQRVEKHGDLFAPVLRQKQRLPAVAAAHS